MAKILLAHDLICTFVTFKMRSHDRATFKVIKLPQKTLIGGRGAQNYVEKYFGLPQQEHIYVEARSIDPSRLKVSALGCEGGAHRCKTEK